LLHFYGLDVDDWPPATLMLTMGRLSLLVLIEQGSGFDMGHAETIGVVERQIRELEGERWTDHPALAHQTSP
jgi:hypothetical protein